MNHADIVRVFSYSPITEEQESDLAELHSSASDLATVIYKTVNPAVAQQVIQQLGGLVGMCRTAIETNPRQTERRVQLVSN